jgi:sarcosine oxidase
VTQQQIAHFAPVPSPAPASSQRVDGQAATAESWPIFIYHNGEDNYYGLPGGRDGGAPGAIKIGEHAAVRATTATDRDFGIDPAERSRLVGFVSDRIPGLTATPVNEVSCLYTRTANEDFILDRSGPFVVASPCSGHGAKFAPVLGEIIADLAAGKPAPDARFTLAAHGVTRA